MLHVCLVKEQRFTSGLKVIFKMGSRKQSTIIDGNISIYKKGQLKGDQFHIAFIPPVSN